MKRFISLLVLFIFLLFAQSSFASEDKETLIILDQSASMIEHYNGRPKIEYAINAINSILSNMSDDENIGLRTVGVHPLKMMRMITKVPNALCRATDKLNPIEKNNKSDIYSSLRGIVPSGASPLQYTLETAINNDFYLRTRVKHIILVTDGYENCDGDPCNYIRRITTTRRDIKIDIITIGATSQDISSLGCLSSSTNGKIFDIKSTADVPNVVSNITARPIRTSSPQVQPDVQTTYNQPPVNMNTMYNPNIQKRSYLLEFYE